MADLFSSVDWKITKYWYCYFSGRHPNPYDVKIKFSEDIPSTIPSLKGATELWLILLTQMQHFQTHILYNLYISKKLYRTKYIRKVFTTRGLDLYNKKVCTTELHLDQWWCTYYYVVRLFYPCHTVCAWVVVIAVNPPNSH